jgi:hypothetical protein
MLACGEEITNVFGSFRTGNTRRANRQESVVAAA